ncbi:MAG: hypothetical protein DRP02_14170 [Candidatus Gerdarchaeota archaeon]|nr:MAG: hypothetical protein DRP02_14170 [Candidatus Gerdarchaeota archaeon]
MRIEKEKTIIKKGLTLIEVLIASALVSFIILGVVNLYSFEFNVFSTNIRKSQSQNEVNIAIEHIIKHIRRRSVNVDISGSNYLQVKWEESVPPSGCRYKLIDNELIYYNTYEDSYPGTTSEIVAKNISQLNFTCADKDMLNIKIVLSKNGKDLTGELGIEVQCNEKK